MLTCPPTEARSNPHLETVLAAFLQAEESGESLDRQAWLTRYPELADDLREFFDSRERVPRLWPEQTLHQTPCRFGDYELLEEIAHGGMGMVYKARQLRPNRIVALKLILSGHLARRSDVERFHAEAEAAASLDHPNIVPIYEVGQHAGQHYFTMKLIEGGSLANLPLPLGEGAEHSEAGERSANSSPSPQPSPKGRGSKPSQRRSAELLSIVSRAIHYAHQRGILHRDLKPSNILLDAVGKPYVSDFGLAKRVEADDSLTCSGTIVGTPLYMAPEQAAGQTRLTTAADIYSLGAILYGLLTGKPAIQAATPLKLLEQVQTQDPVRPRSLNPEVDRDLETICLKCLEKDAARRYGSAEALADELGRWLAGEPIEARSITTVERAWRRCRRNPVVSSLAAAVVLVAVMGLMGILSQWQVAVANEQQAIANAAQAKEQAQDANQQRDEVKALNEKLVFKDKQLQRTLYAAHMNLARHAWDEAALNRMRNLLEQHRPKAGEADLRGFEWHYLRRLSHQEVLTMNGHTDRINGVSYSPDGKRLVSASRDNTVRVWDAATGNELLKLEGHAPRAYSGIYFVSFGAAGTRVASATGREIKLWESSTGNELRTIAGRFDCVAFSADGRLLASGGYREVGEKLEPVVKVWNAETGEELFTWDWDVKYFNSIAVSPGGDRLVCSASYNAVKLWDLRVGKEILTKAANVWDVAFSPDGKWIASNVEDNVELWDAETCQTQKSFKGGGAPVFTPDGKRLAVALHDETTKLWDVNSGNELLTIKGTSRVVGFNPQVVAFDSQGSRLASICSDNTIRIWDLQQSRETLTLSGAGAQSVAFGPDGKKVASGSLDGSVKVWDPKTGQLKQDLKGHNVPVHLVAYSPDGKRLASSGYGHRNPDGGWGNRTGDKCEVRMWDAASGRELFALEIPPRKDSRQIARAEFSADGKFIVSPTDEEVKVWDAETGKELPSLKRWGISSPDGKRMASGGWNRRQTTGGEITIWDIESGHDLLTLNHGSGAVSVAFSPDGKRVASASNDNAANPDEKNTVKIWDAVTGRQLLSLPSGRAGYMCPVAFTPDGQRIASAGGEGVRIWDAETGEELLTLKGSGNSAAAGIAFSPDGSLLAISSYNQTVRIWDASPLTETP